MHTDISVVYANMNLGEELLMLYLNSIFPLMQAYFQCFFQCFFSELFDAVYISYLSDILHDSAINMKTSFPCIAYISSLPLSLV